MGVQVPNVTGLEEPVGERDAEKELPQEDLARKRPPNASRAERIDERGPARAQEPAGPASDHDAGTGGMQGGSARASACETPEKLDVAGR